jgi:membrane protease YdiL (CAAX protease family)
MMAVGEEDLFRTGVTNYLLQHLQAPFLAMLFSAGIFMVYHLAVYADSGVALLYVFSAGLIFAYCDEFSGEDTPSKVTHIINNILAYSTVTMGGLVGWLASNGEILLFFSSLFLLIIILLNRGRHKGRVSG